MKNRVELRGEFLHIPTNSIRHDTQIGRMNILRAVPTDLRKHITEYEYVEQDELDRAVFKVKFNDA